MKGLLLLLAMAVLAGCGTHSSPERLRTSLQTTRSWAATAHLVGDRWLAGAVPRAYARGTLRTASSILGKQARVLSGVSSAARQGSGALDSVERVRHLVGRMRQAVEGEDHPVMLRLVRDLGEEERTLAALARDVGAAE
jgi:hypothetical protein